MTGTEEGQFQLWRQVETLRATVRKLWAALGLTLVASATAIVLAAVAMNHHMSISLDPEGVTFESIRARAFYVSDEDDRCVASLGYGKQGTGQPELALYHPSTGNRCRAQFRITDEGDPAMILFDKTRVPRMVLTQKSNGETGLLIGDANGKERLYASVLSDGTPTFQVRDSKKRLRAEMTQTDEEVGCFYLWRENDTPAASFTCDKEDRANLWLYDDGGDGGISLGTLLGAYGLSLMDNRGYVRASLCMKNIQPQLVLTDRAAKPYTARIFVGLASDDSGTIQVYDSEGRAIWVAP